MNCLIKDLWSFEAFSCFLIITIAFSSWLQNIFDLKVGYGKFIPPSRSNFLVSSSIAWLIYESPNLIFSVYFLLFKDFPLKLPNLLLLSMFILHYVHRAIIYPLKLRGNSRKYPLEIASLAFFFCIFNGYYQVYSLSYLCICTQDSIYQWNFITGIMIFFIGMYINIKSDNILIAMKKRKINENIKKIKEINLINSKKIYGIPHEFIFKYIASPNYLGECLEWIGYGVTGWSLNGIVEF